MSRWSHHDQNDEEDDDDDGREWPFVVGGFESIPSQRIRIYSPPSPSHFVDCLGRKRIARAASPIFRYFHFGSAGSTNPFRTSRREYLPFRTLR